MNWNDLPAELLEDVNYLMAQLQEHDEATYRHCLRVSTLCQFLAEAAGLSRDDQVLAQFSGLLHDVGKMKTRGAVLNKPARLDDSEFAEMKQHPVVSAELLEPLSRKHSFFQSVQRAVLHHHERVDGNGYPSKLTADDVPYISKLILIVDTVDAMTQTRPYRKGLPLEVAYRELERCSGTQFDPELVTIFVAAHRRAVAESEALKETVITFPGNKKAA